jgi:hypothetical protein
MLNILDNSITSRLDALLGAADKTNARRQAAIRKQAKMAAEELRYRKVWEWRQAQDLAIGRKNFGRMLAAATRGLRNILALAVHPTVVQLVAARALIQKETHLYHIFDEETETRVEVILKDRQVVVAIHGQHVSSCQNADYRVARVIVECKAVRAFSHDLERVPLGWLCVLASIDMGREWQDWELEVDEAELYNIGYAGRETDGFRGIDAYDALEHEWDGTYPNLYLLKFLCECREPQRLVKYLDYATKRMNRKNKNR